MNEGFQTIRLVFQKTGRARYTSHLDMNRAMTRAVRRAGVPMWYTEGFNRHPYITFSAPLSLGFEGLAETMDLRLTEDWTMEELVTRLNAVMPEGLRFIKAAPAVSKVREIAAADYEMTFSCKAETVAEALGAPALPVQKRTKKGEIDEFDLKPFLRHAAVRPLETGCVLSVTLPCGDKTINPGLIVQAICGYFDVDDLPCGITRIRLRKADGTDFY